MKHILIVVLFAISQGLSIAADSVIKNHVVQLDKKRILILERNDKTKKHFLGVEPGCGRYSIAILQVPDGKKTIYRIKILKGLGSPISLSGDFVEEESILGHVFEIDVKSNKFKKVKMNNATKALLKPHAKK